MISKTNESFSWYKKDICCKPEDEEEAESEEEKSNTRYNKDKKWSLLRDGLKAENFIINMNSQWKAVFDTCILIVIGWSCFTTVLYISFDI